MPSSDTATTLGAVILAGVGTGIYQSYEEAVRKTVRVTRHQHPNPANREAYEKAYQTYLELYRRLEPMMKE